VWSQSRQFGSISQYKVSLHTWGYRIALLSYTLSVRYDSAGGEDGTFKIVNPNSSFLNRRETLLMSLSYRTACWVGLCVWSQPRQFGSISQYKVSLHTWGYRIALLSYTLSVRYDSAGGEDGTFKIVNPNSSFLNRRETFLMSLSYRWGDWWCYTSGYF